MATSELYASFPKLRESDHTITSPEDVAYNCIAWAAGDDSRWWWPDALEIAYWPPEAPRLETAAGFVAAFAQLGYSPCDSPELEPGAEKVALYLRGSQPSHMARQNPDGSWTSKLGCLEDIDHALEALEGTTYGSVAIILKRPRPPYPA